MSNNHRIHLVRHGQPDLSQTVWLSRQAYRGWWASYGQAGLVQGSTPSNALQNIAKRSTAIVASPILRALQTAELLANGREIMTDNLYVEAPLPAPLIVPFLHAKPWVWGTLSRLTWSYGYSGGGESRRQADARAVLAAQALAGLAAEEGDIMLCGHGWFNRMIGIALRRGGWCQTHNGGDKYWALRTYEMKG